MTKTLSPAYAKRIASYERRYGKQKNRKAARGHKISHCIHRKTYICTMAINKIPQSGEHGEETYRNATLSYWSADLNKLTDLYNRTMERHLISLVENYLNGTNHHYTWDGGVFDNWFDTSIGKEAPHKIDYDSYVNETWHFKVIKHDRIIYERSGNLNNV